MRAALAIEARDLPFESGDWWGDLGDAPFFGVAWLARRGELSPEEALRRDGALARAGALLSDELMRGDLQEKVMASLGVIEHVGASGDRRMVPVLDSFIDRLDSLVATFGDYLDAATDLSSAVRVYGATTISALVALVLAEYALAVGGERADERRDRALAIARTIGERAFGDLVEPTSGRAARAYAFSPGRPELFLYPNVAMIILKARLFRITRDLGTRLEARALYAAIRPLRLSDAPVRYASPYAAESLSATTRNVATLSSQNYLALALLLLFEITGDKKFVDEADGVLDGIEAMRGGYCYSDVDDGVVCDPTCAGGSTCVLSSCRPDHCTSGLLHHVVDGRLAERGDPVVFCAGCNLQTLYVLGYRRDLAGLTNEGF
jgi:hypothetical protein